MFENVRCPGRCLGVGGVRAGPGGPPHVREVGGIMKWSKGDGRGLPRWGLGYSHQKENQCTLYIFWPTGVAGGRAVPPDVREEPGGALYVHSP